MSLVLVKPGGEQGGSGEVFHRLEIVDDGLLGGFSGFPFGPSLGSLPISFLAVLVIQQRNDSGEFTASSVLRRDFAVPANAPVGVGSAVPGDDRHVYYAPLFAPIPLRSAFNVSSCRWS